MVSSEAAALKSILAFGTKHIIAKKHFSLAKQRQICAFHTSPDLQGTPMRFKETCVETLCAEPTSSGLGSAEELDAPLTSCIDIACMLMN